MNFLAENGFEKKTVILPDDAFDPNLDGEAKDYHSDLGEFENQEFYLLNGFDRAGEMEVTLEKLFSKFKMYVLEANIRNNIEFSTEICNQLKNLHAEIEEGTRIAKSLGSRRLEELYKKKLSYCEKAIEYTRGEPEKEPGQERSTERSTVFYSYRWLIDPDQMIPKAYELMVGTWISAQTKPEDFEKVFSYTPIGEVTPISWYEDAVNGLIFFIVRLKENKIIDDDRGGRLNIKLLRRCFRNRSGDEFTQKIAQTKSNIIRDISSKKKVAIDDLINKIIE